MSHFCKFVIENKNKSASNMEPSSTMAPFIIIPIVFVSFILFGIIYWCCIYKLKLKNPSDARRLPPNESKQYLDLIQGKDISVAI